MVDLVIRNGRVVTENGVIYGGIAIEGEHIAHVGSDSSLPNGKREIDVKGNFVIPGLIDPHVHMGITFIPEIPLEERLRAQYPVETEGALHGGVTTIGQFLTRALGSSQVSNLQTEITLGEELSRVDFFCHAGVSDEGHLGEQAEMCRRGVTSFKHNFNAYKGREGKYTNTTGVDEGLLFRSSRFIAEYGYPAVAMTHCEEIDIIYVLTDGLIKAGRKDLAAWTEARPNWVESMRIAHAIEIAKATGAPLYTVHISSAEGAALVREARRQGYRVWGETCPAYLTLTGEMEEQIGCWGKVNPSLKYTRDNEHLWRAILDGGITNMGTDHCGYTRENKERGGGKHNNIWDSIPGLGGGMEHWLPVMMTYGVNAGRISIEDMVRVCSTNNAKVFGLYPRKGVLAPGADADVIIVDPEKEVVVNEDFYHCLCQFSTYDGWRFRGMARMTILRGNIIMEEYQTVGKPGYGRFVPCRAY